MVKTVTFKSVEEILSCMYGDIKQYVEENSINESGVYGAALRAVVSKHWRENRVAECDNTLDEEGNAGLGKKWARSNAETSVQGIVQPPTQEQIQDGTDRKTAEDLGDVCCEEREALPSNEGLSVVTTRVLSSVTFMLYLLGVKEKSIAVNASDRKLSVLKSSLKIIDIATTNLEVVEKELAKFGVVLTEEFSGDPIVNTMGSNLLEVITFFENRVGCLAKNLGLDFIYFDYRKLIPGTMLERVLLCKKMLKHIDNNLRVIISELENLVTEIGV